MQLSREESFVGPRAPNRNLRGRLFAELMAFLAALQFWAEISGAFLAVLYVVAGPLVCRWGGESDAKEIFVAFVGGCKPAGVTGGRHMPKKPSQFDSTLGYPGEDVAVQPRKTRAKLSIYLSFP